MEIRYKIIIVTWGKKPNRWSDYSQLSGGQNDTGDENYFWNKYFTIIIIIRIVASSNLAIVLFSDNNTALPSHLSLQVGVISLFIKSNLSVISTTKWNHAALKELMQLFWRPTLLWENSSETSCAQPWLHISISWYALKQKTPMSGALSPESVVWVGTQHHFIKAPQVILMCSHIWKPLNQEKLYDLCFQLALIINFNILNVFQKINSTLKEVQLVKVSFQRNSSITYKSYWYHNLKWHLKLLRFPKL